MSEEKELLREWVRQEIIRREAVDNLVKIEARLKELDDAYDCDPKVRHVVFGINRGVKRVT